MVKKLKKLSVLGLILCFVSNAQADSFLLAKADIESANITKKTDKDHIIPLIYIKKMEYYNHRLTSRYTPKIAEQLSLEPAIIVTDDENLADYYLQPRLLESKIEIINAENSRYSMSLVIELWAKGGVLIDKEQQNRYIIIENTQNSQQIAQKLLQRLLENALNNFTLKLKNKQLNLSYFDSQKVQGPSLTSRTFISA